MRHIAHAEFGPVLTSLELSIKSDSFPWIIPFLSACGSFVFPERRLVLILLNEGKVSNIRKAAFSSSFFFSSVFLWLFFILLEKGREKCFESRDKGSKIREEYLHPSLDCSTVPLLFHRPPSRVPWIRFKLFCYPPRFLSPPVRMSIPLEDPRTGNYFLHVNHVFYLGKNSSSSLPFPEKTEGRQTGKANAPTFSWWSLIDNRSFHLCIRWKVSMVGWSALPPPTHQRYWCYSHHH